MREALVTIHQILMWPTMVFGAYYAFLGVVALFCHRQRYPKAEDKLKFCIFVPCHNEQTVISATVRNLARLDYNPSLFDIYFLADNCTDGTADQIKKSISALGLKNLYCFERTVSDPTKRGKPHAINWGIERLEADGRFYSYYDMFMVIDADNFADANILKEINSQYLAFKEKKRPVMIQAYLDSKNKNSIIARGYFASYRITNGFAQMPRHALGLVPAVGGTGFAMTTRFLSDIGGYHCTSLTEDLEIQTIATLKGYRIAYNHNARVYDEKPTDLRASAVQRTRWAQGHWYIFFKYGWRLFLKMLNPREIKYFFRRADNLFYLSTMLLFLLSVINIVCIAIALIGGISLNYLPLFVTVPIAVFMLLLFPLSSLFDGPYKEKRMILVDFVPNLFSTLVVGIVFCCYSNIVGLLRCANQRVWRKTAHKVTNLN